MGVRVERETFGAKSDSFVGHSFYFGVHVCVHLVNVTYGFDTRLFIHKQMRSCLLSNFARCTVGASEYFRVYGCVLKGNLVF